MKVLHVASELAPFAQSGGLADVVAGLPAAQAALGVDAMVLVPLYRGVAERVAAAGYTLEPGVALPLVLGERALDAGLRIAQVGRVRCAFLDCPALYDRPGGMYGPGGPAEFGDNHVRFAALGKAAVELTRALRADADGSSGPRIDLSAALGGPPDVLHVHDWQGAPAAIYARLAGVPSTVVAAIHNLAFRGIFPKSVLPELGIPWSLFTPKLVEFYDQISLLKGGLALADAVTAVSPSYAYEILTPERGEALDGFLRHDIKRLVGIVNGIDVAAWDPATDPALPARYSRRALAGKATCRDALAAEARLPALTGDQVLLGVISRMSDQKGLDLVADIAPDLGAIGAKLVVLGSGEPALESRFRYLADTFPDRISVAIGFDVAYARRIYAGTDLFVMPSRFEPCGLGQLYAMRYGSIPIVHAVGGLRDTVIDVADDPAHGTGIRFARATASELAAAIERGVRLYRDRVAFQALQRVAMARDSSWTRSAYEYVQVYRSLRA